MSGWLTLAITVVLVVVAYLILNRTITTRTSQQAALDEIKREVGLIITELNATTERNVELIEDRISRLEGLIGQADKRIVALKRDSARGEAAAGGEEPIVYTRLGRLGREPGARKQVDAREETEQEGPRVGRVSSGARSARDAHAGHSASGPPVPRAGGSAPGARAQRNDEQRVAGEAELPLRERVQMLYLRGLPLQRIASIVGKTVGEVELIVSLGESGKG